MSDKSAIEWTEATWNPVTGCSKVSQGCKHCYAEREWKRMSAPRDRCKPNRYTGRDFTDVACHEDLLDRPLHWKRPRRIFVNSMSDLFHEDVPFEFIKQVWDVIAQRLDHVFQILTKRPERMLEYHRWLAGGDDISITEWPRNAWIGVSCEDQATADERIPLLLQTPAAVRWVSAEPLLSGIDLRNIDLGNLYWLDALTGYVRIAHDGGMPAAPKFGKLDWIVASGESGPQARPMHPSWVRTIRDQCQAAGVPFFFKQWGEWAPDIMLESGRGNRANSQQVSSGKLGDVAWMTRFGKKRAGRTLDGRTWEEYPA